MLPGTLYEFLTSKQGTVVSLLLSTVFLVSIVFTTYHNYQVFYRRPVAITPPAKFKARSNSSDYQALLQSELFGKYLPESASVNRVKRSLLNVKVVGIMLAVPERFSQVIITTPSGRDKVLNVGDEIEDGVKVVKILKQKVLIERDGQIESLSIDRKSLKFEPSTTPLRME